MPKLQMWFKKTDLTEDYLILILILRRRKRASINQVSKCLNENKE